MAQADLLVHVIDATMHGDDEERAKQVRAVLAEIGADERPMLEVYNKIDQVNEPRAHRTRRARRTDRGLVECAAR